MIGECPGMSWYPIRFARQLPRMCIPIPFSLIWRKQWGPQEPPKGEVYPEEKKSIAPGRDVSVPPGCDIVWPARRRFVRFEWYSPFEIAAELPHILIWIGQRNGLNCESHIQGKVLLWEYPLFPATGPLAVFCMNWCRPSAFCLDISWKTCKSIVHSYWQLGLSLKYKSVLCSISIWMSPIRNAVISRVSTYKEGFKNLRRSNSLRQQRQAVTSFICDIPGKNRSPR